MAVARRPRVPAIVPAVVQLALISLAAAVWAARLFRPAGEWLWNLDIPKIDFPLASFFHEALAQGRLPLWNERLGLGFPLYAEGQIGAFYPPNWLLFQLNPLVALDATRVVHLAFAGVGAGLLVLRLRGSRPGAVIAALVAVLGCAITAKLEWHNLVAAYAWLPWVLLPLVRRPRPTRAGLVASGLLFGIQALAGHPNTWLLTGIALTVILVASSGDGPLRGLGRAIGVGLLGAAVGAVQLIPTAVLTTLSVRSEALTPSDLFAAASTPFDILLPGFTNAFIQSPEGFWNFYSVWYPDGVFAHLEAAAFLGLPVLALAAGGAFLRRSRPLAPRRRRADRDPGDRGVPAGDPRRHPVPQRHPVAGAGVHGRGGPDRRDRGHGRRAAGQARAAATLVAARRARADGGVRGHASGSSWPGRTRSTSWWTRSRRSGTWRTRRAATSSRSTR